MRLLAALAVAVLAATLAGCGPGRASDAPAPQSTVTAEPLFATDAEALAAAEKVYREYIAVSGSVDSAPEIDLLEGYATDRWRASELESLKSLESRGLRTTGEPSLRWTKLQTSEERSISIYACLDLSDARLVDVSGQDVTPPDRPSEALMMVTLVRGSSDWLVDGSDLWSNSCL